MKLPTAACLTLLLTVVVASAGKQVEASIEDTPGSSISIIEERGYKAEEHLIVTQDGYILQAIRIVNPLAILDIVKTRYYPVLIHHGILTSSTSYLIQSADMSPKVPSFNSEQENKSFLSEERNVATSNPDNSSENLIINNLKQNDDNMTIVGSSLAFTLSNNLFDVWLLNARGIYRKYNTSTNYYYHVNKSITYSDYWNFSLDEQALYDLPAFIDYVIELTRWSKVSYIGYSQSTTFMFALLASRPEYSEKINTFIGIAPVVHLGNIRGLVRPLLTYLYPIARHLNAGFLPNQLNDLVASMMGQLCRTSFLQNWICRSMVNSIQGPNIDQQTSMTGAEFSQAMQATSFKAFAHFAQIMLRNKFETFDRRYQTNNTPNITPTSTAFAKTSSNKLATTIIPNNGAPYELGHINLSTIVLFRSPNDYLSDLVDQQRLIGSIQVPLYEDHLIPGINHVDFLYGKHRVDMVNRPILRILFRLAPEPFVIESNE